MDSRLVVGVLTLRDDTIAEPLEVLLDLLTLEADLGLYIIEESVWQYAYLLHDHLIDVEIAVIATLREDGDHRVRDLRTILVSDDLRHELVLALSDSV